MCNWLVADNNSNKLTYLKLYDHNDIDCRYAKFKASVKWIDNFKARNGIVSRKVQKIVSCKDIERSTILEDKANSFRKTMQDFTSVFPTSHIWNTDQVGFCYELIDGRTLSWKGEHRTFGCGFSPKNKATHSYTVQYIISMDGSIVGNAFVCLQEPTGRLGPRVEETLFAAPNISLTCSVSGKLTKSHVKYYIENVLKPSVEKCK